MKLIFLFLGITNAKYYCLTRKRGNIMSRKRKDNCCYPMYGFSGGMGTFRGGETGMAGGGIKWIYALLILIVIVLQFGRNNNRNIQQLNCDDDGVIQSSGCRGLSGKCNQGQLIDNSVLFIIVVFLLILCAGCFGGEGKTSGYGIGGGFGY